MLNPLNWLRRFLTFLAALAVVSLIGLYIFDGSFLNAPFWERQAQPVIPQLSAALPDVVAGGGANAASLKPYLQAALSPDYVTAKTNAALEAASDYLHGRSATATVDVSDLITRLAAQGYSVPPDQVTKFNQPLDLTQVLAKPAPIIQSLLKWKSWGIPVVLVFLGLVFLSAPGHHRFRRLGETAFITAILLGLSFLFWEVAPHLLLALVHWGQAQALAAPANKLAGSVGHGVAILNLKAAAALFGVAAALMVAHFLHPTLRKLLTHDHDSGGITPAGRSQPDH